MRDHEKSYFSYSLKRRIAAISKKVRIHVSVCILVLLAAGLGLAAAGAGKAEETGTADVILSGIYTMDGSDGFTELAIDTAQGMLSFPADPLSSYFPVCNYEIDGGYIRAETVDGQYGYTLEIVDAKTLKFLAEESSEPIVIDERIYTAPYDGAVFRWTEELDTGKETASGTEEETETETAEETDYALLSGEKLQELVEAEIGQGTVTVRLWVYDFSAEDREIAVWGLSLSELGQEWYPYYNQAKKSGELAETALPLYENCRFYVDTQVGSLAAEVVDADTFADYLGLRGGRTESYGPEAPECVCKVVNGVIFGMELTNPYPGITNFSSLSANHYFYENYDLEEYYTLKNTYEAYLNHDRDASGEDDADGDYVEVYTRHRGDGCSGMVLVYSDYPADDPYSIEADTVRAGWTNIYLVTIDGEDYIFQLNLDIRDSFGACSYYLYCFGSQVGPNPAVHLIEGAEFSYDREFDYENYARWAERMERYLENAQLLLSTQDGIVRTGPANDYERYNAEALLQKILDGYETW